jgi:uncharacterized protein with von Willebrand factor type A (vWA) domain
MGNDVHADAGISGASAPERIVEGFAHALRRAGMAVPTTAVLDLVVALSHVGLQSRTLVYWAGRATLVRRPEDKPVYDRVFAAFWVGEGTPFALPTAEEVTVAVDEADDPAAEAGDAEDQALLVRYSPVESLRQRDFTKLNSREQAEINRLIAALRVSARRRTSMRLRPSRQRGGKIDMRRTVRSAMRHGGEPVGLAWRRRATHPRRLVILADVSGSMERYARAMLRFAHAVRSARLHVEVFTLATRLTRVTRALSGRDADAALAEVAASVEDWSSGTRLGPMLAEFNDEWGSRGMARGAVVVIMSDGWERGDPALLGSEMVRLHRLAHSVIWVNPLKASPGFQPLAQGMAAALPSVDEFISGHSFSDLKHLAAVIRGS